MPADRARCRRALQPYLGGPLAQAAEVAPFGDGLINETYLVRSVPAGQERPEGQDLRVLQWVSPIFGIAVHEDIEAITSHLEAQGMVTPRLYRTRAGELAVDLKEDGVWRLFSFIPGQSTSAMREDLCREAGRLAGRFHQALCGLRHQFRFTRPGAHDLHAHLRALAAASTAAAPGAPPAFSELAGEILARASSLPEQVPGPLRICHGDLKINNLRFDEKGRGLCLLDLDTLAHLPLCIEMGDALRSWCNPSPLGEDDPAGGFDLGLFRLVMEGYAEAAGGFLQREEREGLVAGVERIALELAARFCADVVNDRYFRWDPARFPSRAAHNLARAQGQLSVARGVLACRAEAEAIVAQVL